MRYIFIVHLAYTSYSMFMVEIWRWLPVLPPNQCVKASLIYPWQKSQKLSFVNGYFIANIVVV